MATSQRLTVQSLADAKLIDPASLKAWGVEPHPRGVKISYGPEGRSRIRSAIVAKDGTWWDKPDYREIILYGLHSPVWQTAPILGYGLLVEGESDVWTAWTHGMPALGIPGANMVGYLRLDDIAALDRLYVAREPDDAGARFVADVCARFKEWQSHGLEVPDLFELSLPGYKDLNELHQNVDSVEFQRIVGGVMVSAPRLWPPHDAFVALIASFDGERGPRPQLSEAALQGVAGEFVRTWEGHTEADPAALLFELLAAFGNLIGSGNWSIGGADHHAKLYVLIIGATSRGRKGTANANVMSVFRDIDPAWYSTSVTGGTASGEGIIRAAADRSGHPILIIEPEFSRLIKVSNRDGSVVSEIVRQAWDSTRLSNLTAKDPVHVDDTHVTIIGHITSEELLRRIDDVDILNGFVNRFLLVSAHRSRKLPEGGGLPPDEHQRLVDLISAAADHARQVGQMKRTPSAAELWAEWYMGLPDDELGMIGAATARAEPQVLRLSMVYALLDGAASIHRRHVEAAIAAFDYCRDTARWLFGDRLGDPDVEKLLDHLLGNQDGATRERLHALWARKRTKDQINAIVERAGRWVERFDLTITEVQEATGGRPRTVIRLEQSGEQSDGSEEGSSSWHAESRGGHV